MLAITKLVCFVFCDEGHLEDGISIVGFSNSVCHILCYILQGSLTAVVFR